MAEAVECVLECDDCPAKIASYTSSPIEIAERAYTEGWRGDREDIQCPRCRRKK